MQCRAGVLFCFLARGPVKRFRKSMLYTLKISYFVMVIYFGDYCRDISYGHPRSNNSSSSSRHLQSEMRVWIISGMSRRCLANLSGTVAHIHTVTCTKPAEISKEIVFILERLIPDS